MMNPATPPAGAANWFRHFLTAFFLVPLVLLLPAPGRGQEKPAAEPTSNPAARSTPEATVVVVRFTDDRLVKLVVREKHIRLNTPYGKLLIPVAGIRSIEFATRIPDADARRASAAVAKLASPQFRLRHAAEAELLKMREKASPALHQALQSRDLEVVMRAKSLLHKLSQLVSEDQLEFRPHDVVRTAESRIAGRIEGADLPAYPFPAGRGPRQLLLLSDLHSLAVGADPRSINAAPDPGNLQGFQGQIGKSFWFKVTGALNGQVWGTKVYTSDSRLAAAAVHAGLLKAGQTGLIRVKIVAPPPTYEGSTRNGVVSAPYGAWPGAYRFIR
jgi:hypothetical protein